MFVDMFYVLERCTAHEFSPRQPFLSLMMCFQVTACILHTFGRKHENDMHEKFYLVETCEMYFGSFKEKILRCWWKGLKHWTTETTKYLQKLKYLYIRKKTAAVIRL